MLAGVCAVTLPLTALAPRATVAVAVATALVILTAVSGPLALGAPGTAWIDYGGTEKTASAFLRDAGLTGASGFPKFPEDVTELSACQTHRPCHAGPYPASRAVAIGVLPAFTGSVTIQLTMGGPTEDAFTCTIPGACPVLATGASRASTFHVTGVPDPGTTGAYVLWVTHE